MIKDGSCMWYWILLAFLPIKLFKESKKKKKLLTYCIVVLGEGVSYRGRVLVKVETKLGEHPEQVLAEIPNEEVQRVGKYLRRRKYRLYCALLDANMVSESDDPVEFEISIGNYGNKLDDSVAPQPSTTQPTNAVYDGLKYYFLPWSDNKPLLIVNSDWEDVSFRLDSLNMLLRKIERLVRSQMELFSSCFIHERTKDSLCFITMFGKALLKKKFFRIGLWYFGIFVCT